MTMQDLNGVWIFCFTACRRPVKIDIVLYIHDQTFRKGFGRSQNTPLPGVFIGRFGGIVLNVSAYLYDDGFIFNGKVLELRAVLPFIQKQRSNNNLKDKKRKVYKLKIM